MSLKDKVTYKSGLTDKQKEAEGIILNKVKQGPTPYTGETSAMSPDVYNELTRMAGSQDDSLGLPAEIMAELREFAQTGGASLENDPAFDARAKALRNSANAAYNDVLGKSTEFGSPFGSNTRGAALEVASRMRAEGAAITLSEISKYNQQRTANRAVIYGYMTDLAKTAQASKLSAAQLLTAAKDLQNRLSWEIFQSRHKEVSDLLMALWGRNVDFAVEREPNKMGPILVGAAAIIGGIVTGGPAGAAVAGTAAQAYVNASQGGDQ